MLISAVFIFFIIPLSSVQGTLSEKKNSTTKSTDHTISSNVPKLVTALLNIKIKNQTHPTSSKPSSVNQTLPSTAKPPVDGDKKHAPLKNTTKSKAHTSSHNVSKPSTTSLNKKVQMQTQSASPSTSKPAANTVSLHFSKPVTTLLKTKIENLTNPTPLTISNVNQTLSSSLKLAVDGDQKHAPSSENKNNTTKSTANTINLDASKPVTTLLNKLKNQTQSDSSKTINFSQTPKPSIDDNQKHLTSSKKKITTKSTANTSLNVAKTGPVITKVKNQTSTVSSKTITVSQTLSSSATPAVNGDQKHAPSSERKNTTKSTANTSLNVAKTGPVNTKVKNHTPTVSSKTITVSQTLSSSATPAVNGDQKHAPTSERINTTKSTANTSLNVAKTGPVLNTKVKNQTSTVSSKTITVSQTLSSSATPAVDGDQKHVPTSEKRNTTKSTANTSLDVSKTGPVLNTKVKNQTPTVSSKTITVSQTLSSSATPAVDGDQNVPTSERRNTTKSTANTSLDVSKTGPVNTKIKNHTPTVSSKTITVSQTLSSSATSAVDGDQNVPTSERKNTTKSTANTSLNVSKTGLVLDTKVKNQTSTVSSKTITVSQTLSSSETPAVDGDQNVPTSKKKNTTKSTANTSLNVSKTGPVSTKVKNQTSTVSSKTITVSQTVSSSATPAVDRDQKHVPTSEKRNTTKSTANTSLDVSKTGPVLNTKVKNQTQTASPKTITVSQTLSSSATPAVDGDQNVPTSERRNTTKSTANTRLNVSKTGPVLNIKVKNQTPTVSSKTITVSQTLLSSETPAVDGDQNVPASERKNTTKSTANTSPNVSKTGPVNTKVKDQTPTLSSKTITVSQTLTSSATPAVDGDQKHAPTSERKNTTKSTANTSPNVSKPGPVLNTKVKNQTQTASPKTITVSQTLSSSATTALVGDQKHVPSSEKKKPTVNYINVNALKPVTTLLNNKLKNQTKSTSSKTLSDNQTPPSSSKPTVGDQKHIPSLQGASTEKKNTTTKSTPNNVTRDVSKSLTTLLNTKTTKQSQATSSKSKVSQTLPSSTKPAVVDVHQPPKDKPAVSSPIKVVITEGCVQKEAQTDSSNTTKTQETELSLEPGSPLVMTHHIKLVPGTCTGGCETEMTALRDRVEFLEKEMSTLKKMCIQCSEEQCPKNCSGQGKCEGGKCVCHQGFGGPDCSGTTCPSNCNKKGKCVKGKCVCQTGYTGPACSKGIDKTVETVTLKTSTTNNSAGPDVTSVVAKPDKTIFVKRIDTKDIKAKPSPTASTIKTNVVKAQSNTTRSDKVILTVGQALLKLKEERRQQQATKGKTTVIKMSLDKRPQTDLKLKTEENKESTDRSTSKKNKDLKDQPVNQNVTQSTGKKINGTSKVLGNLVKDTKGSSNGTTSRTKATIKTVDEGKVNKPNGTSTENNKKLSHGNVTTVLKVEKTSDKHANWTSIESKPHVKQFNRTSSRSSVIGLVKVHNITSTGFIMSWEAPLDTFKNFTVTRREIRPGNDVEDSEKIQDGAIKVSNSGATAEDITGVQSPGSTRIHGSKLDGRSVKKFSHVLPGTARSYHFKGLQPQTQYSVSLFGSGPGVRSKIHRLTLYTGPEPPSDLMFSNITETALILSWMKPKSIVAEFKVTYTNSVTGESGSMSIDSQLSHVLLSKLSAGTTYDITVRSLLETLESEPITASVTTVPDSPTELKVMNITDSKALLVWKPSQAKVDSYILSYGSTKSPNVTITVTLSGSTVEHQLRSLQRSSLHMVKITSQVNRLQSRPISTTFTTGSGVKLQVVTPYEVTFHSAVISWKAPRVVFKSYRLTYQPTKEVKEVILNPSVTQYELTGLAAFTNYTVKIEGERDGLYLDFVSAEFTTAPLPYPYPTDCSEVQMNGVKDSGEVEIYPEGKDGEPVWVYCDMETDEGGWTVFQRRMDGSTDFFKNWRDYSKGFGLLTGEFWLGNDVLHTLTSLAPMSLRIDLRSGNDTAYAYYDNFNISSEADHYAIELSGYSGTAGDSMRYHNGRPFSTKDKDPDILSIHCAKAYMGGWWYKNCYKANLNGLYGSFSENKGVVWIDWKGKDASLPFTEMKLRPSYLSQRALTTPTTQG